METNKRLKKGYLHWRCRRGTKELDVMLTRYLEKYDGLSDQELIEFDQLLSLQDTQLWNWLTHPEKATDKNYSNIIIKINNLS